GEIWYIPGAGLMAGIKGLRKAARLQIEGNFWPEFEEIRNPDERNFLMIPEGALAFRCIIRDSNTLRAYSDAWEVMREKGIPAEIIPTIVGKRPYTEGIGYVKRGESTRMDPVQVAMKRAEADALKRRFDLPFVVPSEPNDVIDGDWAEAERPAADVKGDIATLYGDDGAGPAEPEVPKPPPQPKPAPPTNGERPYPPEVVRQKIDEKTAAHLGDAASDTQRGLVTGMLEECFAGDAASDKKRHTVLKSLFGVTSSKGLTPPQVLALLDWLRPQKDSGGAYAPEPNAAKEAQAIVTAAMKEAGQGELI
ncbi:MAG: regulatory protein GemA, partial [Dehalococcoidia bacterium]|nr:regulatory protein GemA [Dehalococcoidia bacterium]